MWVSVSGNEVGQITTTDWNRDGLTDFVSNGVVSVTNRPASFRQTAVPPRVAGEIRAVFVGATP